MDCASPQVEMQIQASTPITRSRARLLGLNMNIDSDLSKKRKLNLAGIKKDVKRRKLNDGKCAKQNQLTQSEQCSAKTVDVSALIFSIRRNEKVLTPIILSIG